MNNHLVTYYQDRLSESQTTLFKIKKVLLVVSLFRLISFSMLIGFFYELIHSFQLHWLILLIASIGIFLGMISWFVNLKNQEKFQTELCKFIQNELNQLEGGENEFDDGSIFEDGNGYWSDLDVFGKGSLFHCINRSVTEYGKIALANQLKYNLLIKSAIEEQQEAIKIYSQQINIVESTIVHAMVHKSDYIPFDPLFKWLSSENKLHNNSWAKCIRIALPPIQIAFIFLAILKENNAYLGIVFIVGWSQIGLYAKYLQSNFSLLSKKEAILKQYTLILEQFEKIDPKDSIILKNYKASSHKAHIAIKALSKISNRIDQRLNIFLITIVNPIFLYDIQNMFSLESWKIKYQHELENWIQLVGEIEKLNSYALFVFNNPEYIFPTVIDTEMEIDAIDISHPLIGKSKRIPNSFHVNQHNRVALITGSNMSGKTTFLRTIGINMVLAQNGLPVSAIKFSFSPMQIFSSIRISDSLQESTSYFMAELKKLSYIKSGVQEKTASLVLIDEILRGTNSEDKFFGSAQFIKGIIESQSFTLFATHDLKLSELELEFPDKIQNYCFESMIENNELTFSYQIQRGVAKNRNASFLMKKMGII